MSSRKRVVIIDQLNLFFRSYIVNPSLSTNGFPIGGLKGTIASLQKICREIKPDEIIFCWDGPGGSVKRKKILKDYKAGRAPIRLNREVRNLSPEEEQENKIWQQTRLVEYFNNMPVVQLMYAGTEADDVISYVKNSPHYEDWEKIIISSDKDFFQLLDDTTVLYRPIQKQVLSKLSLIEMFGIHPNNFALARAMAGDNSDNLEGVGGVGLKTIAKRFPFLSEEKSYTIDELLDFCVESLETKKIKAYENVLEKKDIVERNYKMMQLYVPFLSIDSKKDINNILENADISFNKTKIIKLMNEDGFGNFDWFELQTNFKRIVAG